MGAVARLDYRYIVSSRTPSACAPASRREDIEFRSVLHHGADDPVARRIKVMAVSSSAHVFGHLMLCNPWFHATLLAPRIVPVEGTFVAQAEVSRKSGWRV